MGQLYFVDFFFLWMTIFGCQTKEERQNSTSIRILDLNEGRCFPTVLWLWRKSRKTPDRIDPSCQDKEDVSWSISLSHHLLLPWLFVSFFLNLSHRRRLVLTTLKQQADTSRGKRNSTDLREKAASQCWHRYFLSPVWSLTWRSRDLLCLKSRKQKSQRNGISSLCACTSFQVKSITFLNF